MRPISAPAEYRKAAERYINSIVREDENIAFENIQFGVGKPFGGEIIAHTMQIKIDDILQGSNEIYCHQDFENAYCQIKRSQVLKTVEEYSPKALGSTLLELGFKPNAVYYGCQQGPRMICLGEALTQGGPRSSALYGLGTMPLNKDLNRLAKEGGGVTMCYVDDNHICTTIEATKNMLQHVIKEGPKIGVHPNFRKYRFLLNKVEDIAEFENWVSFLGKLGVPQDNIRHHPDSKYNGVPIGDEEGKYGNIVMGIPVGSQQYMKRQLEEVMNKISSELDAIIKMENGQWTNLFLRTILDCKVVHLLRGLRPLHSKYVAMQYTEIQKKAIASIAQVNLKDITDLHLDQARTPFFNSGLSLTHADNTRTPAFIASITASLPSIRATVPTVDDEVIAHIDSMVPFTIPLLKEYAEAILDLNRFNNHISVASLVSTNVKKLSKLQHMLTKDVKDRHIHMTERKISQDPPRFAAYQSASGPRASAWLSTIPKNVVTKMSCEHFGIAIRNLLYIEHPSIPLNSNCICDKAPILDRHGIHLDKCANQDNAVRIARHNTVQVQWGCNVKLCGDAYLNGKKRPFT